MHLLSLVTIVSLLDLSIASQLEPRNPYYGGYGRPANMGTQCPSNLEFCQYSAGCCPIGTWCSADVLASICCPTQNECQDEVGSLPTCADPSWTMYLGPATFCCPPGEIGVFDINGYGECVPTSGITYSLQDYATTTAQANTASPPPPSLTSGASTTSSSKATTSVSSSAVTAASTNNAAVLSTDGWKFVPGGVLGFLAAMM